MSPSGQGSSRWVKVNEKRKLHDVLKEPNFIIPGIPGLYSLYTAYLLRHAITITTTYSRHAAVKYKIYVCFCWFIFSFYLYGSVHAVFYVVSKTSSFYKEFKGGKWSPPPWLSSIIEISSVDFWFIFWRWILSGTGSAKVIFMVPRQNLKPKCFSTSEYLHACQQLHI